MCKFIFLFYLTLICLTSKSYCSEYIWPKYEDVVIPDSLAKEDAIFIKNNISYDFSDAYESSINNFKRIKILSNKGLEDFKVYYIPLFYGGKIQLAKSRIIKGKTKEIIELDDKNIKETFIKKNDRYSENYSKKIQFIYPNLEVGDIIDVVYDVKFEGYINAGMLYLEDVLTSLNTKIQIRNFTKFEIIVYSIGFNKEIKWINKDGGRVYIWENQNIKKLNNTFFNAIPNNLCRLYFNILPPGLSPDFQMVYHNDLLTYPPSNLLTHKIKWRLDSLNIYNENDFTIVKLDKIINKLSTFKWLEYGKYSPARSFLEYYNESKINEELFFKYIQLYLDENEIKYNRCYTNSLLEGKFVSELVIADQYKTRFLYVSDEEGNFHYIFAPQNKDIYYNIDEIPFYSEGNKAIIFSGDKKMVKETYTLELPVSNSTENKISTTFRIKYFKNNLNQDVIKKDIVSGHFSNLLKQNSTDFWFSTFGISDSIISFSHKKDVYPYELTFIHDTLKQTIISDFEENMIWMSLDSLIPSYLYFEDEESFDYESYVVLPFSQSRIYSIYIEGDNNIFNQEQKSTEIIKNEIGEIYLNTIQVNPKVIKIEVLVKVNKRIIENIDEVNQYRLFLQKWKELNNKKIIIKK